MQNRRFFLGATSAAAAGAALPFSLSPAWAAVQENAQVPATATIFGAQSIPPKLDYVRQNTRGRNTREMFNDFGFVVRAKAETGEDLCLWTFLYEQRGREVILDNDVCQTAIVCGTFSEVEKARMNDTPFINKGQNIEDYFRPTTLQVTERAESVTWSLGGRSIDAQPSRYRVYGEHAGVACDIDLQQNGPCFSQAKPFEDLGVEGAAGFVAHGTANGTVVLQGKTLKISGYFVVERWIMSGPIPSRMKFMSGPGLAWAHAWSPEFSWYVKASRPTDPATAMITVGSEQFGVSGAGTVEVTEVERWTDPRSLQSLPRKWTFTAQFPQGRLEAEMSAYGRAYYTWTRRGGQIAVNQFLSDATAKFTFTDGRVLQSKQLGFLEHMRTFYDQDVTAEA